MSSSTPQRTRSQTSSTSSSTTSPPSSHDHHAPLCSAYSSAAKATEDWTTIEDRTERRRIQNRIAQRAYRQKLKERLISLERKAASSSSSAASSPSPEHEAYSHGAHSHSHSTSSSRSHHPSDDSSAHFEHAWSASPEISEFHFDEGIHMPAYLNAATPSSTSSSTTALGFQPIAEEDIYYTPQAPQHLHHLQPHQLHLQHQHHQQSLGYAPFESLYPDFDTLSDSQHTAYGAFAYPDLPFETYLRS